MRPLNSKFFGENAGPTIAVTFNAGSGAVSGWIVKQVSSARYLVTDGTDRAVVRLTDTASPAAGFASIAVTAPSGTVNTFAKVIRANRLVTTDNRGFFWRLAGGTTPTGYATVASR